MDKIRAYFRSEEHRAILALGLCFPFMFFFYAPLEAFLTNSTEFWFDILDLLPVTLICFIVSAAVLTATGELIRHFPGRKAPGAFCGVYLICFAVFLIMYIQGNYIPRDYGVLDGHDIDWDSYVGYAAASIVIIAAVAALCVLAFVKFRKYVFNACAGICAAVFAMLLVALISILPQAEKLTAPDGQMIVTDKNEFVLSPEKNIYVMVLDGFDGEFMRELIRENGQECSELFENFTYYENSVGCGPNTKTAIPFMLTGEWYENGTTFEEYVRSAYQNKPALYENLKKENYSIDIYTSPEFLTGAEDYCDNILPGEYKVNDSIGFAREIYKMVLFEYLPHQLKRFFLLYTGDFDKYMDVSVSEGADNSLPYSPSLADEEFYRTVKAGGITLKSGGNCFKFVHLKGMHQPFQYGEDVVFDGGEHGYRETLEGNLNIIRAFFAELKEKGIYDKTAVIIAADHGNNGSRFSRSRSNPLLLVKGFGEKHGFTVSDADISWEDFYPTLNAIATGEDSESAVWNIDEPLRKRRFLDYTWDSGTDALYMPEMTEYTVSGNISRGEETFSPTGRVFSPAS